jgi:hypothetical protein
VVSPSISSRNSVINSQTEDFEIENPLAISTTENPSELEVATVRRIAAPR